MEKPPSHSAGSSRRRGSLRHIGRVAALERTRTTTRRCTRGHSGRCQRESGSTTGDNRGRSTQTLRAQRDRDSRTRSPRWCAGSRTHRSGSAPSRSDCSRPRASWPRPSARTRSSPTRCARPGTTSRHCATRWTSSPSRRRPTRRCSASTTTAPSTCRRPDARCASRSHPTSSSRSSTRGAEVVLNESYNVVMVRAPESSGEIVTFKELLDDGARALVVGRADEERVAELADQLDRPAAEGRRHRADGPPLRSAAGAAAPTRGRGAGARGGARTSPTRTSAASTTRSS